MSTLSEKKEIYIKKADLENISGILSVLEKNLIINKHPSETPTLEERGFLIHGFTQEDLELNIPNEHYSILVAMDENKIIGYIMGCDLTLKTDLKNTLSSVSVDLTKILSSSKVFYHRHIAKENNIKNIGTQLLQKQIETAKNLGFQYIICQIAHAPFQNKISLALHEKFDFACMGTLPDGEYTFGIYVKTL